MTMRQLTLASLTSLVCTCWCGTATVSACLLSVRSCNVTRAVAGTRAAAHLEVHAGVEQQQGEERHGAVGDQVHVDDVHLAHSRTFSLNNAATAARFLLWTDG